MFNRKYRIKQKGSIYYIRWFTDPTQAVFTDVKDEALLFNKATAKLVIKNMQNSYWFKLELERAK